MTLLDEDKVESLTRISMNSAHRKMEGLRSIIWTNGTPPGMKTVRTPVEKRIFAEEMQVKAAQEQRGQLPGDLNTVTANNPHVQQAMASVDDGYDASM